MENYPIFQDKPKRKHRKLVSIAVIGILIVGILGSYFWRSKEGPGNNEAKKCSLLEIVRPESFYKDNSTLVKIMYDDTFRNQSALKLSGAVQLQTDINDNSPTVEGDPDFWKNKFEPFHSYLEKTFPLIWENFKIEKVNSWGLVITWKGANDLLKPILLTAHQDVVPIQDATIKDWTFPPYDGIYDGKRLWGRGSADCKNLLIGLLESAEELFKNGFEPSRTIIYAFGFDEEIGGTRGAKKISEFLLERYGNDSFYALVDEGGQSIAEVEGVLLAMPGTGEKGAVNVKVGLNTPGGHSSVPPDHTSIGIMSHLLSTLEDNTFEAIFSPQNPTFYEFQCIAEHSNSLNPKIKDAILRAEDDSKANKMAIDYITNQSLTSRYLISTSQAIDIIHGGVKSNALPEYVEAIINHRIAIESSISSTIEKDIKDILKAAEKYDLGVIYGDKVLREKTPKGYFTISLDNTLDPAPSTPINDDHWKLFGGSLRHLYEELSKDYLPESWKDKPVVVAPGIATGNTDTKRYWDLTKYIYRYRPGFSTSVEAHAHGVDENIPFESHLQIIAFYYQYLQLVDKAED